MADADKKVICANRKARFLYRIDETFEAGLVLTGSEVKSLRAGKAHLNDAYGRLRRGELYLLKAHIAPYEQANRLNHEPDRERKLLVHRRELARLGTKLRERGFTLVPTQLYFKNGRVKVELGLGKGKRAYDKRETEAKRASDRDLAKEMKRRRRG